MQITERVKDFFGPHNYLEQNDYARTAETVGLDASLKGGQVDARAHYEHALKALEPDGTADVATQRGSVLRNYGFTYVREALVAETDEQKQEALQNAHIRLREALGETALFASRLEAPKFKTPQADSPHRTHKKMRRELLSEHAATLGLIARTATAAEVTLGKDNPRNPFGTEDSEYGWAHDFARLGTNAYYRVSNAMNNARQERMRGNDRLPHTVVALSRAAFGIVWSIKNDRGNFVKSSKTFARRLPDLRSPATARSSVFSRP